MIINRELCANYDYIINHNKRHIYNVITFDLILTLGNRIPLSIFVFNFNYSLCTLNPPLTSLNSSTKLRRYSRTGLAMPNSHHTSNNFFWKKLYFTTCPSDRPLNCSTSITAVPRQSFLPTKNHTFPLPGKSLQNCQARQPVLRALKTQRKATG